MIIGGGGGEKYNVLLKKLRTVRSDLPTPPPPNLWQEQQNSGNGQKAATADSGALFSRFTLRTLPNSPSVCAVSRGSRCGDKRLRPYLGSRAPALPPQFRAVCPFPRQPRL
jgi:hypothetical protein